MKKLLCTLLACATGLTLPVLAADPPLRVFIRAGVKTHGPGAHDHPRFMAEWKEMLNQRGMKADGWMKFPTKAILEQTDVLVLHSERAGNMSPEERTDLEAFLKRGGGLVVLHAAAVADDADWYKQTIGGSWRNGTTKWLEAPMSLYFSDSQHPIIKDCSNFDLDDEIYYDMDLLPDVHVLAAAYTPNPNGGRNSKRANELTEGGKRVSIYDIQPQMWTYERTLDGGKPYRAFVSIPGHYYETFNRPNYRAIVLRGIAWAGHRKNIDEFCKPDELGESLRYVEGGPTRPDKMLEKIEVHPDFKASLIAAEPLVNKVMNIDWDERGRLWACETPEYPNGRRVPNTDFWKDSGSLTRTKHADREPTDRISILSDTNGDGIMDKKHVFADGLELVTSFCFYKTGVIACAAPDIWLLEDTNGDDTCDKRTKLYTGLGTGDTHAVINNLRWGQDGWIYATHGYSTGHAKSGDGTKDFGGYSSGVVRFLPDGSQFEQYSSRGGNTWGLCMTWDGQCFWTQPTSGTVFFHTVLPESILAKGKMSGVTSWKGMMVNQPSFPAMKWEQQAYVQIDQVGNFTAAAGCAIYEGGSWPQKWNYSYFTTEPTISVVHHEFVHPDGVSYTCEKEKGREQTEFMRSKDLWFRPIETRIGPDGDLYVVDFCNQAIIHNDTRGPQHGPANAAVRPDRDHYFSRIWRVTHKDAKKLAVPVLKRDDIKSLVEVIKTSPNSHVKQNAWRLVAEKPEGGKLLSELNLPNGSKAEAIYRHAATSAADAAKRNSVLGEFLAAKDGWTQSAIVAAAADHPVEFIAAAISHGNASALADFVASILPAALRTDGAANAAKIIQALPAAGANSGGLAASILQALAKQGGEAPAMDQVLTSALSKLATSSTTASAVLPLIAKWDKSGAMASTVKQQIDGLVKSLADAAQPAAKRVEAAQTLLGVRSMHPGAIEAVGAALTTSGEDLAKPLIAALGETDDRASAGVLIAAYSKLSSALQSLAYDQLLKRADWSRQLLEAMKAEKIKAADLGPANVARLRTHPDKSVARAANAMLDVLISPAAKEKAALIAKLAPEVSKPGDPAKGKAIFAACAICHQLGNEGKLVGPPLNGMGAHGPAELLVHIIDPNREVDPSFHAWNVTKKNGETLVGVIAAENQASVTLRTQVGEFEIRKDEIASRENTKRSLMPEGFEGLGPEVLRDLLAFICGSETRFRIIDLKNAYSADGRRGLFIDDANAGDTVFLAKTGNVTVENVPFFIMDPAKSQTGSNLVALKGGPKGSFSDGHPVRVEAPVGVEAKKIHLLSGIAGWGFPAVRDTIPVLKLTLNYEDGQTEVTELKNGIHFSDYNREIEVPGSKLTAGVVNRGQLRLITVATTKKGVIKSLSLESYQNGVSPVVVAITADLAGAGPDAPKLEGVAAPAAPAPRRQRLTENQIPDPQPVSWEAGKTKVLIVAGGSSHDFRKWFEDYDMTTLKTAGLSVNWTENSSQAAAEIKNADVAVVSVNRDLFDSAAWREALFAHITAGKGVVMLHPGTWYGYPKWPELNAQIVGGGAKGHDALGPFKVNVKAADHPIMKGVPASFDVIDELYYVNPETPPTGTAKITVLAETSPSKRYSAPHPSVWITENPKARIVGIALGHDGRVHEMDAFKSILTNSVKWAAKP